MAPRPYTTTLGFCNCCGAPLRAHDLRMGHAPHRPAVDRGVEYHGVPSVEDTGAHLTRSSILERGLHQSRARRIAGAVSARRAR